MHEIILHQVTGSAHGEGIRLILGYKGLPWREVALPPLPPRPQLAPLTGPYRRQPVLQVGADVYCDHRCIIRFLEETHPEPPLYPAHDRFFCELLSLWAEPRVFLTGAGLTRYQDEQFLTDYFGKDLPRAVLMKDRQALLAGSGFSIEQMAALRPYSLDQLRAFLGLLEAQLSNGHVFLTGSQPTLADFATYIPTYLINMNPRVPILDRFPRVLDWLGRVAAIGYGSVAPMEAAEALEIARRSRPGTERCLDPNDPVGRKPGDRVTVTADDYGMDSVAGELVASDAHEVAIRRSDPAVGEIVLHFPKVGFRVCPAGPEQNETGTEGAEQ